MKLSEEIRDRIGTVDEWADEVAQLEAELAQREQDCIDRTVETHAAEAENEALRKYAEFVIEKDYGAEFDEWCALLTGDKP